MIPRILHHIWLRPQPMSAEFLRSVHACRESHPAWEQFIWTDGRLPALRMSSTFHSLAGHEDREELLRYELLAQFGGVAVRAGIEPASSWDALALENEAFLVRDVGDCALFGPVPRHDFVEAGLMLALRLAGKLRRSVAGVWLEAFRREVDAINGSVARPAERLEWRKCLRASRRTRTAAYGPENIVIALRTVDRQPQYVHQTLASMFMADTLVPRTGEVLLLVGNEADGYLKDYLHHAHVRVLPLSAGERVRFSAVEGSHQRFNFNFCRSLKIPLDGKLGVLSCEDDITFREGFLRSLLATIREIEEEHGIEEYMLQAIVSLGRAAFHDPVEFYEDKLHGDVLCPQGMVPWDVGDRFIITDVEPIALSGLHLLKNGSGPAVAPVFGERSPSD